MKRSRYTTGLIGTAVCLLFANSTAAQQSTLPTGVHPVSPREGMAVSDPEQLLERTPGHLVQDMHAAFGVHHARAVHSKGTILQGWFEPERAASALSSADRARRISRHAPGGEAVPHDADAAAGQLGNYRLLRRERLPVHQRGRTGALRPLPLRPRGGGALPHGCRAGRSLAQLPERGDRRASQARTGPLHLVCAGRRGGRSDRGPIAALA